MKIQSSLKLLLAATLAGRSVLAETEMLDESEMEFAMCDSKDTCTECLEAGVCDWYGSICSHNTMMIADIAMYSVDPDSTIAQVCERAELDEADRNLCSTMNDCASCTATVLSDSVSTCNWNAEFGFCGPELCTMMGCGVSNCADTFAPVVSTDPPATQDGAEPEVSISCSSKTTCEECVAASGDGSPFCAWVPALFYESYPCTEMSCDLVADPKCFSREKDDRNPRDICASLTTETDALSESAASVIRNTSFGLALLALLVSLA